MTTDITELAPAMKAAAEKASGGDWVKESGDGWDATCSNDDQANSGFIIAHFVGPDSEANREFVQLANPANIRALVEALEKAQRHANLTEAERQAYLGLISKRDERIAELEQKHCGGALMERELAHSQVINKLMSEIDNRDSRIAELESRTVTVKLPERYACELGYNAPDPNGDMLDRDAVIDALTAAGIKWEAE